MKNQVRNHKVDVYLSKSTQWHDEFELLREIALETGLTEDFKWGNPCYTLDNANVVLIHGFKEYCAFLLFKGALLEDPKGILIRQTENVQSSRQIRFTSVQQIEKLKGTLKKYIRDAIDVEEAGLQVVFKKPAEQVITQEFKVQ